MYKQAINLLKNLDRHILTTGNTINRITNR